MYMRYTWLIHMCDITHAYVWHDSFICDMTHSYVWHDSFICDMTDSYVWHDWIIRVTWLIYMRDMTHVYAWNSFICVTWLIHTCDMTHFTIKLCHLHRCLRETQKTILIVTQTHESIHFKLEPYIHMTHFYAWNSFICVTWLIHMCDMTHLTTKLCHLTSSWLIYMRETHSYVWHDSFIRVIWPIWQQSCAALHPPTSYVWHDSFIRVTWLIHPCDMTHLTTKLCHLTSSNQTSGTVTQKQEMARSRNTSRTCNSYENPTDEKHTDVVRFVRDTSRCLHAICTRDIHLQIACPRDLYEAHSRNLCKVHTTQFVRNKSQKAICTRQIHAICKKQVRNVFRKYCICEIYIQTMPF